MAHNCEPNHNRKWWGKVEHRKPWISWCSPHCELCLENRVHSIMKKYLWRMEEYEDKPEPNRMLKITVHKFAGWSTKTKPFRYW